MFITKTKVKCQSCKKQVVNDIGLGDSNEIDKEYRTESSTGQMLKSGELMVANMLSPGGQLLKMIPGTRKDQDPTGALLAPFTYGASVIPGMVPDSVMNPIKKTAKTFGVDTNPLSMALMFTPLGVFGAGASLLPGVSQLLGKAFKVFSGFFKKATHMGDCMKWWNIGDNLRGMTKGAQPYPIEWNFSFEDYMMKNFPQFLRQYQIMQAGGQWASVGVDSYLNSIKNEVSDMGARQRKIQDAFVRLVRQNPEIMQLACAVNERAETGYTGHTVAQIEEYWSNFRESARQEEYNATSRVLENVSARIDQLVAPFKVKETWGAVVKSRDTNLAVKTEYGSQLRMPENVIGVSRGALVMTLKTPQGQPTPIGKK